MYLYFVKQKFFFYLYSLTDVIADWFVFLAESVNTKKMIELKVVSKDFGLLVITVVVQDGPITRL